ncbi:zinc finger MYND domain-containing protein [Sporobolomyces salmoneus]|uniref:zinc finger MYND domain-containing protein n=1 Tax=Sporobolomyces salmoneus TaxID=183962 RepID=UPI003174A615
MSTTPQTTTPCSICDKPGKFLCSKCKLVKFCSVNCQKLLHPTHKLLCGKDPLFFAVPPLSKAEAHKLDSLRHIPWDAESEETVPLSGVPREIKLFELIVSLGLYQGDWQTLLSRITEGGALLEEPQLSLCVALCRSQLRGLKSFPPQLNSSVGVEAFNVCCQQPAVFILCYNLKNPFQQLNTLLRRHLVLDTFVALYYGRQPGQSRRSDLEDSKKGQQLAFARFYEELRAFNTAGLDEHDTRCFAEMIDEYKPLAERFGWSG